MAINIMDSFNTIKCMVNSKMINPIPKKYGILKILIKDYIIKEIYNFSMDNLLKQIEYIESNKIKTINNLYLNNYQENYKILKLYIIIISKILIKRWVKQLK